jgi:FMN reductase
VLSSMGARHIVQGWFVLDRHITALEDGSTAVETGTDEALGRLVDHFSAEIGSTARLAATG